MLESVPSAGGSPPDIQEVLDGIADPDNRRIIEELAEPKTASEISEVCDIPISTTYRKLELLVEADLVEERTRIKDGGSHSREYVSAFESIEFTLADSHQFDMSVVPSERTAVETLTTVWFEIREAV